MITKLSVTCIDDGEFLSVMETDMNYLNKESTCIYLNEPKLIVVNA